MPSYIWSHMIKNQDGSATCKYCQKKFKQTSATTSKSYHLEKIHEIKPGSIVPASPITDYFPPTVKNVNTLTLYFIIKDLHSLSSIEGEGLYKFLALFQPGYVSPCRQHIWTLLTLESLSIQEKICWNYIVNNIVEKVYLYFTWRYLHYV